MAETLYDVLIVGGGLVGTSLACALRNTALKVGLIEASAWTQQQQPPGYDDRVIALNYGSQRILTGLGIWHQVASQAVPIQHIHVSDQGRFGFTRLDRQQLNLPALGYTLRAKTLGQALQTQVYQHATTQLIAPATLDSWEQHTDCLQLQQAGATRLLKTRLLVLADGGNADIRRRLGIRTVTQDYQQTALIATVTLSQSHRNIAYERFTVNGPLALIPLAHNDCALVWTIPSHETEHALALNDQTLLATLQTQFGWRLGRFVRIGQRQAYPLKLIHLRPQSLPRTVIIGNAAHTLHPIAGQGFNLGLRDVASLTEAILSCVDAQHDLGDTAFLRTYQQWQQPDQKRVIQLTDQLVTVFSNDWGPLSLARNTGLVLLDAVPPLKTWLMRQMAGLHGHPSRLLRGLPPM
jgi:2-octaprenyl-6-methoxyphenol hydroxylase